MSAFWKERNIDIFKDGVSVPGLTMKYLFSNVQDTYFSLFTEKDKDLYYTMKDKYRQRTTSTCKISKLISDSKKW